MGLTHLRILTMGMVGGCSLFAYFSYKQQSEVVNRQFLDPDLLGEESQWAPKLPDLTKGLQFMEQRLLFLETQIQELGRSHSTSSALLLRPMPRLMGARQKGSPDEATLNNYRVSVAKFASAGTLSETEPGFDSANAIDQDDSTRMACAGCVWTGDFGRAVVVFSISIEWESCDCKDDSAAKIEVSLLPGGPWLLYSHAGGFKIFGSRTKRDHVMMADARYVRISMTESSETGFYSMWEVAAKIEAVTGASEDTPALPPISAISATVEQRAPVPPAQEQKKPEVKQSPPASPAASPASDTTGALFRTDNKCGKRIPLLPSGGPVQCNPLGLFPCCSAIGWCGNTIPHCNCPTCVDYRTKTPGAANALPAQPESVAARTAGDAKGEVVVAVIIPFRDRETHLELFKPWWNTFAKAGDAQKVTRWEIYVAEQFDGDSFNRGWNFNVGLALAAGQTSACEDITDEMKVPFKCAAIQDIDYLPEKDVDYSDCPVPMQLSSEIDRYDWKTPYLQSAGGIVSANLGHWQQINGFSNDYYGWGGEDDEIHHRLRLTGLLYGDCYPFCKANDPAKGKVGLSIKRPPKGHGRFSGAYMHSANHTKRITDHKAYQQNVKLLQQIQSGSPRWRSDGLSNLAFRIVSYKKDTTYLKDYGVTYHHVKAHRGRDVYDPKAIQLAIPTTFCEKAKDEARWHLGSLGDNIPWDLKSLRAHIGNTVKEHCDSPGNSADTGSFILVDRRYHLAKILSDDNPGMLVAFYRGLKNPKEDGLIIADPRTPDQIREAFNAVNARVSPPTEYTICTSTLGNGDIKFSMHQGPACAGGWMRLGGGTFWAFTSKKATMKAVTFCDNPKFWVQRIVQGETCVKEWAGLKWSHGGTFWVPEGNQFCVGTREEITSFSQSLPEQQCNKNPFKHDFSFGTNAYAHTFGSFTLCIGQKGSTRRVGVDPQCNADGFRRLLRFRVRLPKLGGSYGQEFCVRSGADGDVISNECQSTGALLKFSLPPDSVSTDATTVCAGSELGSTSRESIGIGEQCEDGPSKTVDVKFSFKATSVLDVAASTPDGGDSAYPLYTLVDEDVGCMGFFCSNVVACAERSSDPSQPCAITKA